MIFKLNFTLLLIGASFGPVFGLEKYGSGRSRLRGVRNLNRKYPEAVERRLQKKQPGGILKLRVPGKPDLPGPYLPGGGPQNLAQMFGLNVLNDGYNDTPLYCGDEGCPTLNMLYNEEVFLLEIVQESPVSEFEDDLSVTIEGQVGNIPAGAIPNSETGVFPGAWWKFALTFEASIERFVDPNKYTIELTDGELEHVVDPHPGVDNGGGPVLKFTSKLILQEQDDDFIDNDEGGRPAGNHPAGNHIDKVSLNDLAAHCCDDSFIRPGIKSWDYSLIGKHDIPPPEAFGDPHFQTWTGLRFDYHGECDLVLLSAPMFEGGPLDIHIRTKIRHGND